MNLVKRYWRIIFPIFFIIIIWGFSAASGEDSNSTSSAFAASLGLSNAFARKLAHFTLFAGFAYSCCSFAKGLNPGLFPTMSSTIYCIIFPIAYAAIDEIHQLSVAGRNGSVADILLDSLAGIFGTLLYIAIFCFVRRARFKKILGH